MPRIRQPTHYGLKHSNNLPPKTCNPLQQEHIPPEDLLRHWEDVIRHRRGLAMGHFYMETSLGTYDDDAIQICRRLHKARSVKKKVEDEIDWFARGYLRPSSVAESPNNDSLLRFKRLMWTSGGYGEEVPGMNMDATRLSWLCCDEEISSDHMSWFQTKLNSSQEDALVMYVNCVQNIERFATRNLRRRHGVPKVLVMLHWKMSTLQNLVR